MSVKREGGMENVAHVKRKANGEWDEPHALEEHIRGVAGLAEHFASAFANGDWGRLAGLWHDLGKYKPAFQEYIRKSSGYEYDDTNESAGPSRVDHSIVGALWAEKRFADSMPDIGRVLGYLIAGHHAGLPDWAHEIGIGGALGDRLKETEHLEKALEGMPPQSLLDADLPSSMPGGKPPSRGGEDILLNQIHLWVRMLYSCLVDADFLDTESYMDGGIHSLRTSSDEIGVLPGLKRKFDLYMSEKEEQARLSDDSLVNRARAGILAECRAHAAWAPGLFSLTVPTGGGKTLSGMAFALEHAIRHGKRRVVVVIPYTSIIEQTAKQYREIFGDEAVIEHHSNLDPERESERSKLASENWDAPIIVTTNVQFFESLFAARSSACRKLHNLVDSVIILDEAQILPPGYLQPVVSVLKGLSNLFGASIVLCTATQPALAGRIESGQAQLRGFSEGSVREIMSDPRGLSATLKRIELKRHSKGEDPVSWEEIAAEMRILDCVLCVVNTRKDCRDLFELLPEGSVHLSALMCPEHRSEVVARIKAALAAADTLRVVSTQLVEAGVDIDFPVVYRALAGLDSMAQAAGRCNREGKLNASGRLGQVIVFRPPKDAPSGLLRKGQDAGSEMLRCFPEEAARLDPDLYMRYFKLYYKKVNSFDEKEIMRLLAGPDVLELKMQFRTAASKFSLIEDGGQKSVIVLYEAGPEAGRISVSSAELVETLEKIGPNRDLMRRLQRFSVNIPSRAFNALEGMGSIRQIHGMEGLYVQEASNLYDPVFGLKLEGTNLGVYDLIS
jgi:CRISPR-associated endonuclease/helicase Cas3